MRLRRLWSTLLIVLIALAVVAGILVTVSQYLPQNSQWVALAVIVSGIAAAIKGGFELWDKVAPIRSGKKKSTGTVSQETYLKGRLAKFEREKELFVALAGEIPIKSQFSSYKELFSAQEFGETVKVFDDISQAAHTYDRFVIVGDPGSGKTTTLRNLAVEAARKRLKAANTDLAPLPFWIELGRSDNPSDFYDLLNHWWSSVYRLEGTILSKLEHNDVWLMLDGLNEIPEQGKKRANFVKSLARFLDDYPDLQVIITCRLHDYDKELNLNLPVLRINPLDDCRIEEFAQKRLAQNTDQFLAKLTEQESLKSIARNPYTLVMLIDVFLDFKTFPKDSNSLYGIYVEKRHENYAEEKKVRLSWEKLEQRLQKLAYRMITSGKGTETEARWVQWVIGRQALKDSLDLAIIVWDEQTDTVRFYHHSLHQFFALPWLMKQIKHNEPERQKESINQILSFGKAAAPVLPQLTDVTLNPFPDLRKKALVAAVRANSPNIAACLIAALKDPDEDVRAEAADQFKWVADPAAVSHLLEALNDPSSKVRNHAVWALGDIGDPGAVTQLVEHLVTDSDPVFRDNVTDALVKIGSPAVTKMTPLLFSTDEGLQFSAVSFFGGVRNPVAIPDLIKVLRAAASDNDFYARRSNTETALAKIGAPAIPPLLEILQDSDANMRREAAAVLGLIPGYATDNDKYQERYDALRQYRVVAHLIKALDDDNSDVRRTAAESLGKLRDSSSVSPLIEKLSSDPDSRARSQVANALGVIGDPTAVSSLIEILTSDPDSLVRSQAAYALGYIGDADAVPALIAVLGISTGDDPQRVQSAARNALSSLCQPPYKSLIEAMRSDNEKIREGAAAAFGAIRGPEATKAALEALNDPHAGVRAGAAHALHRKSDKETIPSLISLIDDPDPQVRIQVIHALGGFEDPSTLPILVERFGDEDGDVRAAAIASIYCFENETVIPKLIPMVKDPVPEVRLSAIDMFDFYFDYCKTKGLDAFFGEDVTACLLEVLDDPDAKVINDALEVLGKIGDPSSASRIVPMLANKEDSVWFHALRALSRPALQQPAIPALIIALDSSDEVYRGYAVQVLGRILKARTSNGTVIPRVIALLIDPSEWVSRNAATALKDAGDPAIPALVDALCSKDPAMRAKSAEVLNHHFYRNESELIQPLIDALEHPDSDVRSAVVHLLGKIDYAQSVMPLVERLNDPVSDVRKFTTIELSRLGDPRAVEAIINLLEREEEDEKVRLKAIEALGNLGDARAVPLLIEITNTILQRESFAWEYYNNNHTYFEFCNAAEALGDIGDLQALPILRQAFESLQESGESQRRRMVIDAFGKIGDACGVPDLLKTLHDGDWQIRAASARALGIIGDQRAVPELIERIRKDLEEDEWEETSVEALGKLGGPTAAQGLFELAKRIDDDRKTETYIALANAGDPRALAPLLNVLHNDDDHYLQVEIIEALGRLGDAGAVDILLETLNDNARYVSRASAWALTQIGDDDSAPRLIEHLHDGAYYSEHAAIALGYIGGADAEKALLEELGQNNQNDRWSAAEALAIMGKLPELSIIEEVLNQGDKKWRKRACKTLGIIGDDQSVLLSISTLKDKNVSVRLEAMNSLMTIGTPEAIDAVETYSFLKE